MPSATQSTPPPQLLAYLGHSDPATQRRDFDEYGRRFREEILALLPEDWRFDGKRVLDFGCGSGRVLRHFLHVGAAELHGCDVDGPSIDWLREHQSPPLEVRRTSERPPLPYPDEHFDLIWSTAVLDSLAEGWSEWLLELHRVLAHGGLFITSFLGEAAAPSVTPDETWDEDRIGMNVLGWGERWQDGAGPVVLHSAWWIRAHWGRAFDILELKQRTSGVDGVVLMRKRAVELSPSDLEAPEPGEPRELEALRHNLVQLRHELARTGEAHNSYARQVLEARELLERYERSLSWRMTRPLRKLGWLLRGGRTARP
jgi:SAM-dependent methyltransferase